MDATEDDGSCEGVVGCDQEWAINYNPLFDEECEGDDCGTATCIVNDSCVAWAPGCTDETACNFDENANVDDESCETESCAGCQDETASNFDAEATISAPDHCLFAADVPNDYEGDEACDYYELDTDEDGVYDYMEVAGCTEATACNYNEDATDDDGSCEGACDSCDDDGVFIDGDLDDDGVCDNVEIQGCTDMMACNYNSFATEEDGSCVGQLGCDDDSAVNYSPDADCFDNEAYEDGICESFSFGCMDELACNYDADANFDPATTTGGTSCTYPAPSYDCDGNCIEDCDSGDGVCDDLENGDVLIH